MNQEERYQYAVYRIETAFTTFRAARKIIFTSEMNAEAFFRAIFC